MKPRLTVAARSNGDERPVFREKDALADWSLKRTIAGARGSVTQLKLSARRHISVR